MFPPPPPPPMPLFYYFLYYFTYYTQHTAILPAMVMAAVAPPICEGQGSFMDPRHPTQSPPPPPPPSPPKMEWRPKNSASTSSKSSPASKTTLMIKNIPNQLRRDFMLKFLDGFCKNHSLAYDFFYLPFDFRKRGNRGYAFVNMTSAGAAIEMQKLLCGYKWHATDVGDGKKTYSRKVCDVQWAKIQGKEALVRRFKKSRFGCDDVEFLPVDLDPPRDGSDPNPPPPNNLGKLCPSRWTHTH